MYSQLQEIAETPQAKFEWWLQTFFKVLPSDSKFTDLTTEQMDLMYQHYKRENPPTTKIVDDDYDAEEQKHERYEDPDFDKVWDSDDEEDSSDIVAEIPPLMESVNEMINEDDESNEDIQDWEEVQ